MGLAAGKLRHRVALQSPSYTQDPTTGENALSWTTVATVSAAIEPLSAREFLAAQANQSEVSARIVIRRRSDVAANWRAVHMVNGVAATIYNIHGVLADKDSGLEYQTLVAAQGVNDGE